jgi:hypothetical protein
LDVIDSTQSRRFQLQNHDPTCVDSILRILRVLRKSATHLVFRHLAAEALGAAQEDRCATPVLEFRNRVGQLLGPIVYFKRPICKRLTAAVSGARPPPAGSAIATMMTQHYRPKPYTSPDEQGIFRSGMGGSSGT